MMDALFSTSHTSGPFSIEVIFSREIGLSWVVHSREAVVVTRGHSAWQLGWDTRSDSTDGPAEGHNRWVTTPGTSGTCGCRPSLQALKASLTYKLYWTVILMTRKKALSYQTPVLPHTDEYIFIIFSSKIVGCFHVASICILSTTIFPIIIITTSVVGVHTLHPVTVTLRGSGRTTSTLRILRLARDSSSLKCPFHAAALVTVKAPNLRLLPGMHCFASGPPWDEGFLVKCSRERLSSQ